MERHFNILYTVYIVVYKPNINLKQTVHIPLPVTGSPVSAAHTLLNYLSWVHRLGHEPWNRESGQTNIVQVHLMAPLQDENLQGMTHFPNKVNRPCLFFKKIHPSVKFAGRYFMLEATGSNQGFTEPTWLTEMACTAGEHTEPKDDCKAGGFLQYPFHYLKGIWTEHIACFFRWKINTTSSWKPFSGVTYWLIIPSWRYNASVFTVPPNPTRWSKHSRIHPVPRSMSFVFDKQEPLYSLHWRLAKMVRHINQVTK